MNYVMRGQEGLLPISNPRHKRILLPNPLVLSIGRLIVEWSAPSKPLAKMIEATNAASSLPAHDGSKL